MTKRLMGFKPWWSGAQITEPRNMSENTGSVGRRALRARRSRGALAPSGACLYSDMCDFPSEALRGFTK